MVLLQLFRFQKILLCFFGFYFCNFFDISLDGIHSELGLGDKLLWGFTIMSWMYFISCNSSMPGADAVQQCRLLDKNFRPVYIHRKPRIVVPTIY